jgi:hypothetical protein
MIASYGVKLEGGPWGGQRFEEKDLFQSIRAAQNMGRTDPLAHPGAWVLGYQRVNAVAWQWQGVNCHPDPIDDDGKVIAASSPAA